MPSATPPTRPALRARYDERRQALIDAAAKLFAERGYEQTSIGDLSDATGLAAGGIYHYTASKEGLLIAICDELLDPLLEQARAIAATEATADDHLRQLLHTWLLHIEGHIPHMLVFTQERHTIEREPQWRAVRRKRKQFEQILDGVLVRGEADGSMAFEDRGLALLALLGMVNYAPQWLRPGGRRSAEEIADVWCNLFIFRGVDV
ncbi:MAG TPA: TetR/AcrR family transcriptional regulator [Solirubrobacterales bacterium]